MRQKKSPKKLEKDFNYLPVGDKYEMKNAKLNKIK